MCPFEFVHDVDILGTYHDIDSHILTESLVHALELMSDKLHKPVLDHLSVEDVGFTDEVCHESVLRLVVYVCRGTDLPDVTVVENHDGVGKRKGFLLIVSHIYECDAQLSVHFLEFDLHVLAHLEVKSGKRLVEKKHLRLVHDRSRNGHTLLLTA